MSKKPSLSEKLAELASTAPVFTAPDEDDVHPETRAKVADWEEEGDSLDEAQSAGRSQLRARAEGLLQDVDKRYSGKCVSRKELLKQQGELMSDEDEDSGPEDDQEMGGESGDTSDESQAGSDGEDDIKSDGENESAEEVEGHEGSDNSEQEEEGDDTVQVITATDISAEIEKGKATKCQLGVWDNLLEMRISLQKVLSAANRLPQHDTFPAFQKQVGGEFQSAVQSGQSSVKNLLDKFLELQHQLLRQYPETKNLGTNEAKEESESDEEIPSDSDEEAEKEIKDTDADNEAVSPKKMMKLEEYESHVAQVHSDLAQFRDSTIQKWNDKTRVAYGKTSSKNFSAFEQSTLKQISQLLSDKERLIRRTQLKRSVYRALGRKEAPPEGGSAANASEYDPEVFDDDDFYHQLLRELIERDASGESDPTQLGRKLLELQKLRSKLRRKVDTKASKGRKIRYDIHNKLVNFMAPVTERGMAEAAKSELFNSLFGQVTTQSNDK